MEKEQTKFRVLMFPWLAHGHIFPFLELAKSLPKTKFHVYICSTPVNLVSVKTNIHNNASIELVELDMASTHELPPQLHTTKNLPSYLLPTLLKTFQTSSSSFSEIVASLKPDLLIYDVFQPWAPKIALSQGIPSVFFATSGATAFAFYHHLYNGGTSSTFPYHAIYLHDREKVDRILPNIKDACENEFAFGIFNLSKDIILMKSCRGVEGKYIDYLSTLCGKQIVPTGPLITDAKDYDDDKALSMLTQWLDGKGRCSTVYISFGSECFLSKEQLAEVSKGLELCTTNFIWVIRFPVEEDAVRIEDVLPIGFLDRSKDRGMIIRWAPQTKILSHASVGGFVSHCGWSSTFESMYFGVPIIGMPMKSEQPINVRLTVEAGVGVEVKRNMNGMYMGKDVAKAISMVIEDGVFSDGLRNRAKKMSEEMKCDEEAERIEVADHLWRICMK